MKKIIFVFSVIFVIGGCNTVKNVDDASLPQNEAKNRVEDALKTVEKIDDQVELTEENGERFYVNKKFGFKNKIPKSFSEVEYFPDDIGMFMKHNDSEEIREKQKTHMDYYSVEIGATAIENTGRTSDLAAYVLDKFPGYSLEYYGSGVFVDERDNDYAIRHYFFMNEGRSNIYEAYLRVPAFHYNRHKEGFDDFTKTIQLF
jgi:hypothetical protein